MRCIDADHLIGLVKDATILGDGFKQAFIAIVRGEPTIEPERNTGKWQYITDGHYEYFKCNQCGKHSGEPTPFCRYCGAKMEEGENR